MQTKNKPTLRFKNFKEDWGVQKLDDLTDKISDGIHTTPNYSEDGEFYFINGNNLSNGKILLNESTKRVDEEEFNKLKVHLNSNTILLSINGTIGNIAFFNGEQVVLGKSAAYLNLKANHNKYFAFYSLQSPSVKSFFNSELTGSTIMNLSLATIKKTIIGFPSLPEQTKIATFLSAIDEKIERQQRLLTLWQTYKKGIMQQIFSQQLRFKNDNGEEYPGWEETQLGRITRIIMGQSPDSNSYNTEYIGIPLIQGNADCNNRITSPRYYTTQITKRCSKGDIIMTVRAPVGAISKSLHDACIGRGVCAISNTNEFIYQFLLMYEDKWAKLSQGSTFTAVNSNDIRELSLTIPCIEEQTKIATFLTSLDGKIAHIERQLTSFREFKKGLLQQMFV